MKKIYKAFLLPGGLFAGAIVGAGMFSLPYVFARVGVGRGIAYTVIIGAIMALVYMAYADLLVKTPGKHNFVSLARMYLGDLGEWLGVALTVVTMVFVLYIYLVLAGRFMGLIMGAPAGFAGMPLWLFGSAAVFFSLRRIAEIEWVAGIIIFGIVAALGAWAWSHAALFTLSSASMGGAFFWLPVGPLLFAFGGRAATSELVQYAAQKNIRKIIIGSFAAIAALYIVFAVSMVALTGGFVATDGISELTGLVSPLVAGVIGALGLLALWHVYILLAFDAVHILKTDIYFSPAVSRVAIIIAPLMLYAIGSGNFFALIALVGGIFAALENICILLMWFRMRAKLGTALLKKFPYAIFYALLAAFIIIFIRELAVRLF